MKSGKLLETLMTLMDLSRGVCGQLMKQYELLSVTTQACLLLQLEVNSCGVKGVTHISEEHQHNVDMSQTSNLLE